MQPHHNQHLLDGFPTLAKSQTQPFLRKNLLLLELSLHGLEHGRNQQSALIAKAKSRVNIHRQLVKQPFLNSHTPNETQHRCSGLILQRIRGKLRRFLRKASHLSRAEVLAVLPAPAHGASAAAGLAIHLQRSIHHQATPQLMIFHCSYFPSFVYRIMKLYQSIT